MSLWATFLIGIAASAVAFVKYAWFISIGYRFAAAAIFLGLLERFGLVPGSGFALMPILHGLRLRLYLQIRKRGSRYIARMKGEIKDGKGMALGLVIESAADIQKSWVKAVHPTRFVDTGLYRVMLGHGALRYVRIAVMGKNRNTRLM